MPAMNPDRTRKVGTSEATLSLGSNAATNIVRMETKFPGYPGSLHAMILRTTFSAIAAGALAALLSACSTLKPVADTTRYYTLVAPPATAAAPAPQEDAPRVGIRVTVQTDYLRRAPIAVRVGTNELRFASEHRWAERINEAIERALTSSLQQRLADAIVLPVTPGSAAGAALIVDVAIAACEGTTAGEAVLEGFWKMNGDAGAASPASGHFRRSQAGWNGSDYAQLASLLGALIDELAAELAPLIDQ
jgi:uncharacterized lipoprotein YmbA